MMWLCMCDGDSVCVCVCSAVSQTSWNQATTKPFHNRSRETASKLCWGVVFTLHRRHGEYSNNCSPFWQTTHPSPNTKITAKFSD